MTEYKFGNAIIVVSRPKLTEKEKAKREGNVLLALQQFGKAMQKERVGK